jgi:hypothetical protein
MSNSGIIVYNNSSNLVLDNTYKNFYLSRKIMLSGTGITTGTFASGEYIAAVGGLTGTTLDAFCENTTTGWTCTVNTYQSGMAVFVLSTNIPTTDHGNGLEIRDATGKTIFNSNVEPARILAFGQGEQGIPTGGNYKYAIATGSPVTEKSLNKSYTVDNRYSTIYHQAVTYQQYVAATYKTELQWQDEKYHYDYQRQSDGSYKMVKVIDQEAGFKSVTVVDVPAHYETVTVTEAYTDYIDDYTIWETDLNTTIVSNFRMNSGRIAIGQKSKSESTNTIVSSSGQLKNQISQSMNIINAPGSKHEDYAYTINPTSFLLIDVSGL